MRSGDTSPRQARTSSTGSRSSARPSFASAASSAASAEPRSGSRAKSSGSGVSTSRSTWTASRCAPRPRGRGRARCATRAARPGARRPAAGARALARRTSRVDLEQAEGRQPAWIGRDAARLGDLEQLLERLGVARRALARVDAVEAGERHPPARVAAGRADDRVA